MVLTVRDQAKIQSCLLRLSVLSVMLVGSYTWHWFTWFLPYCSLFWCLLIFSRGCRLGCTLLKVTCTVYGWMVSMSNPLPLSFAHTGIACLCFHRVSSAFLCPSSASIPLQNSFLSHLKSILSFPLSPSFCSICRKFFSIVFSALLYLFAEKKKLSRSTCKILVGLDKSPACP